MANRAMTCDIQTRSNVFPRRAAASVKTCTERKRAAHHIPNALWETGTLKGHLHHCERDNALAGTNRYLSKAACQAHGL